MQPVTSIGLVAWIGTWDWGTVPAWFTGLSLLLAFWVFARQLRRDDRELVDKVAVWTVVKRLDQRIVVGQARNDGVDVTLKAKNAADVPVEIYDIKVDITSRWMLQPDTAGKLGMASNTKPNALYWPWELLSPGEERDVTGFGLNLRLHAPDTALGLDPMPTGVIARVVSFYAIDNAGRRWHVRPGLGNRARRIRWYSRGRKNRPPGRQ